VIKAEDVSTILLDAGGVLIFPAPERLLPALRAAGVSPDITALERAHYQTMVIQDLAVVPPARDTWWQEYLTGYVAACGVPAEQSAGLAAALAREVTGLVWTHVGTGAMAGLRALAALGLPLGIVSNSDGTVAAELLRLGICDAAPDQTAGPDAPVRVGVVVDSSVAKVAKPDPAIFGIALDALTLPAGGSVLHVGDSLRYDVAGALAAGLQPVHMDPFGLCPAPAGHPHVTSLTDLAIRLSGPGLSPTDQT
jgi:putative hydrolase of the HAD superfamily